MTSTETITWEASRRRHAEPFHPTTAYRASFSVYAPCPRGGSWVVAVQCRHAHTSESVANVCADRTARYIERFGQCPPWADDQGQIAGCEVAR